MSTACMILPRVWAMEELLPSADMSYYRRYTEALLRRYMRMSMEAGRAPSLLGREMFRGNVTHYRVKSFEDVVIADLSVLKSQMKQLLGGGQPGRLTQLEERVERHEQAVQRLKGLAGAFGGILTILHFAIEYVRRY